MFSLKLVLLCVRCVGWVTTMSYYYLVVQEIPCKLTHSQQTELLEQVQSELWRSMASRNCDDSDGPGFLGEVA